MADIVPTHLAVEAMRDNGYKNVAYALAELMDNSIQAGASQVELLCGEKEMQLDERRVSRIDQIAVLDNGSGMNNEVLEIALQFGNGMYLDPQNHTGIGRFGMGLPCSSVSQCQRVDVWTWQNGIESAIHSYLDLKEIRNGNMKEVPQPALKAIPQIWNKIGSLFGETGTLVVWSKIDRCLWRTGKTIVNNSEFLIGRMYRKILEDDKVKIRMVVFDLDNTNDIIEKFAKPNDPMYLMKNTSCPEPYDSENMFQKWGDENYEATIEIEFRNKKHDVKVRFSYAKEEARKVRDGINPGSLPYGKHAARNVGVSIVRANRELDLDVAWSDPSDARDRWWGIEVEFPPSLDDLFGVTNNKQFARNFSDLAKFDIESQLEGGKTLQELKDLLFIEGDPHGPLLEIVHKIHSQLNVIRRLLRTQTVGTRGRKRHETTTAEEKATKATRERQEDGHTGVSDKDENLSGEERKGMIKQSLEDDGTTKEEAEELAAKVVTGNLKYLFNYADLETPAFFSVKPRGGAIVVTLNVNHPAYENLIEVLEESDNNDDNNLTLRLQNATEGIKLLLSAWARYEDEQPDGRARERAQEARVDWGRLARRFLEREDY